MQTHTGRDHDTQYYYRLQAFDAHQASEWSDERNARTWDLAPAPAANLQATGIDFHSLRVHWNWTHSHGNVTGFDVQYRRAGESNWQTVSAGATDRERILNDLSANTSYQVRVTARNADYEAQNNPQVTGQSLRVPQLSVTPANIPTTVTQGHNTSVQVEVKNVTDGVLSWSAEATDGELSFSPAQGTVAAGAPITVSITCQTADLPEGAVTLRAHFVSVVNAAEQLAVVDIPVTVRNLPAEAHNVHIRPNQPLSQQALSGHYTYSDQDGHDKATSQYRWYRDGELSRTGSTTVPATDVLKGQTWQFEVTVSDIYKEGATVRSSAVTIGNAPPSIAFGPTTTINQGAAYTLNLHTVSSDPDDQVEDLTYSLANTPPAWLGAAVNGHTLSLNPDPENWGAATVRVWVSDGDLFSVTTSDPGLTATLEGDTVRLSPAGGWWKSATVTVEHRWTPDGPWLPSTVSLNGGPWQESVISNITAAVYDMKPLAVRWDAVTNAVRDGVVPDHPADLEGVAIRFTPNDFDSTETGVTVTSAPFAIDLFPMARVIMQGPPVVDNDHPGFRTLAQTYRSLLVNLNWLDDRLWSIDADANALIRSDEISASRLVYSAPLDPDGGPVAVSYAWTRDGEPFAWDRATLPNWATLAGDHWQATVTAEDLAGAVSQFVFDWTVANRAPVIAPIPPQVVQEADWLWFRIEASDPEGHAITYGTQVQLGDLPGLVMWNPSGQTFFWYPNYEAAGDYELTFTATDALGAVATQTVAVTVLETHRPPYIHAANDIIAYEGETLDLLAGQSGGAFDLAPGTVPLDELRALGVTFEVSGWREGEWNADLTYATTFEDSGQYTVEIVARTPDGLASTPRTIHIYIHNVNRPPWYPPVDTRAAMQRLTGSCKLVNDGENRYYLISNELDEGIETLQPRRAYWLKMTGEETWRP